MRPAASLIYMVLTLMVLSVIQVITGFSISIIYFLTFSFIIVLMFDAFFLYRTNGLALDRNHTEIASLNRPLTIKAVVKNTNQFKLKVQLFDIYPEEFLCKVFPVFIKLAANEQAVVEYDVTPVKRGLYGFDQCHIKLFSRLGLLTKKVVLSDKSSVKIYPDYMPIIEYGMLKTDLRTSAMGLHTIQKKGEGLDFLELREYQQGDSLRQIDWRSTSRLNKTISRQYQVEQDQSFIFVLDCSHRMNTKQNGLTHFDQVLNAMLLTSYIALKQGDAVGYITVGATKMRWKKPVKGVQFFHHMLSDLYDVQPTNAASDYIQVAEMIPKLFPKRATLIMVANLRDNETDDIAQALGFLRNKYSIILANIREQILEDEYKNMPESFEQALTALSINKYLFSRQRTINKLKSQSYRMLDIFPDQLAISLANEYLRFKSK